MSFIIGLPICHMSGLGPFHSQNTTPMSLSIGHMGSNQKKMTSIPAQIEKQMDFFEKVQRPK